MSPSSQIPQADIAAAWERASQHVDGHLYAVRFTGTDGDVVKVGRSTSIANRLRQHRKQAPMFGLGLTFAEQWVSEPHLDYEATELLLLAFCREQWRGINGGDWFMGANHAAIAKFGASIPKKTWNETRRKARAVYFLSAAYPLADAVEAVGLTLEEVEAA